MAEGGNAKNITATPLAGWWLLAVFLLWLVSFAAPLMVRGTELSPIHFGVVLLCVVVALIAAVATWIVVWSQTGGSVLARMPLVLFAVVWAAFGLGRTSLGIASILEMRHDFPAGATQTFTAYWPISRAYEQDDCRGRGCSEVYYIQPMPATTDAFPIAKADFDFMRTHQPAASADPHVWEVNSNGYFCARAVFQRSGNALRVEEVTHDHRFPDGSIVVCPPGTPGLVIPQS